MKVLHLSTADNQGGSARSAYRLHTGLRARGWTSRMLVKYKVTRDPDVALTAESAALRFADKVAGKIQDWMSVQYHYYPSSSRFHDHPWFREADVFQIYNTHGNYFAHTVLPRLTALKPTVWRLSDMWPLTGHCSYSYDCTRWKTGCGQCPILDEYPPLRRDTTAALFSRKQDVYSKSKLTLVAPSRWLAGLAAESPLLSRFKVHHIPNGIDTRLFHPVDKRQAKAGLGLDVDRPAVLFHDPGPGGERKGRALLPDIVGRLSQSPAAPQFIVFGRGSRDWDVPNVRSVGEVLNIESLCRLYSSADLFLFPTLAENLPNVAIESMACGTPVASFIVGGMPDLILPGHTGALVSIPTAEAMAAAANQLLASPDLLKAMAAASRQRIESEFTAERELDRFETLYRELKGAA